MPKAAPAGPDIGTAYLRQRYGEHISWVCELDTELCQLVAPAAAKKKVLAVRYRCVILLSNYRKREGRINIFKAILDE